LRANGIYGVPLQTIAAYVVLFMVFASLLGESGAGKFFIELATAATGRFRGGPAKAAVVASACFGSISGSAIANVAGTGCLTIPLMKKIGYSPTFAGAVEAVSSNAGRSCPPSWAPRVYPGGQCPDPLHKADSLRAFARALYFAAVFCMVDCRAATLGLKQTPKENMPDLKKTLSQGWHLFLPIICWSICSRSAHAQYSSMFAIISLIVVCFFRKWTRLDGYRILRASPRELPTLRSSP
jgi:TRAP-type uncharacterized transport system fused permease subunit